MLEISNWKVYDLEESIDACRYSMFSEIPKIKDAQGSLDRAIKLAKCATNSGECNFLCGIRVSYDIKYPIIAPTISEIELQQTIRLEAGNKIASVID